MSNALLNAVFEHSKTTGAARAVLIALADTANAESTCWPSVRRLAQKAGLSQKTVRFHVSAFCRIGLVFKKSRMGKGGRQTANLYCINTKKIGQDWVAAEVFDSVRPPSRRAKNRQTSLPARSGRGCSGDPLPPLPEAPPPPSPRSTPPFLNRLEESEGSTVNTGFAGTCACSPSALSGAAAPAPPPDDPEQSVLDSVESAPASAPAKPEVTSFKQARAILGAAKGAPIKEKLLRVVPYGERTRFVLGYLLIWQALSEEEGQNYSLCEAHFVQAGELAKNEEVQLGEFCGVLRAAWKTVPSGTYDPLFMCSHHSKKFTLFCKHFRRMQDELLQALNEK